MLHDITARLAAVALPARNEAATIVPCVAALLAQTDAPCRLSVHVLANNCDDGTARVLRARFGENPALQIREATLPPDDAHAGGARRLAMEMAADSLNADSDLILSTDADSIVARDWLVRTLAHFDQGHDAVAGRAVLRSAALAGLTPDQRRRLRAMRQYQALLSYLRNANCPSEDRWPTHSYEGGASLAVTRGIYHAIGGCPPLPVGEDRALFDAVRLRGGRIRHAPDVRVFTSGRLVGRATGGMADTIRRWCLQPGSHPIGDAWQLDMELGYRPKTPDGRLTFDTLPAEIMRAKALAQAACRRGRRAREPMLGSVARDRAGTAAAVPV